MTWQVLAGAQRIPVCLFEATERVDDGPIYARGHMELQGHELVDELRDEQARVTIELCQKFVDSYPDIINQAQTPVGDGSVYPKRTASDSALDPLLPISEQFNLLRVVDNQRYPAHFDLHGQRYYLAITTEPPCAP